MLLSERLKVLDCVLHCLVDTINVREGRPDHCDVVVDLQEVMVLVITGVCQDTGVESTITWAAAGAGEVWKDGAGSEVLASWRV